MLDVRYPTHPEELVLLDGAALRARFLLEDLFIPGQARLALSQQDRIVIGGILPAEEAVRLPVPGELRSVDFCDRREVAIACLEGPGTVTAGEERYEMGAEDVLYLGVGTKEITVAGSGSVFYLVSALAGRRHPNTLIHRDEADELRIGDLSHANARTIRRYVGTERVPASQLTLGITTLEPGSVWNTMPCHLHDRRSEVYLYFGLPPDERVFHFCGRPEAIRSIVVADRQAVISPPWSIHFGVGTSAYRFVWATAGENQTWDDMDPVATRDLR